VRFFRLDTQFFLAKKIKYMDIYEGRTGKEPSSKQGTEETQNAMLIQKPNSQLNAKGVSHGSSQEEDR
jgi:hypothetical protein